MSATALDELAALVVSAWLLTHGADRLQAGEIDVLGPGEEARAALDRALRQRFPGSPGLGCCWAAARTRHGGPPRIDPHASALDIIRAVAAANAAAEQQLDAFVDAVLRAARGGGEGPPGEGGA
jgi:hypothetical protein